LISDSTLMKGSPKMTDEATMKAEIAALRADNERLRADRLMDAGTVPPQQAAATHQPGDASETEAASPAPAKLQEIQKTVQELADTVESDISERPVASVAAAFVLGILIGRLSAR
jgi:ElaB/YqjD/DUF883 family membrane-anchored ribosome-binding protein